LTAPADAAGSAPGWSCLLDGEAILGGLVIPAISWFWPGLLGG